MIPKAPTPLPKAPTPLRNADVPLNAHEDYFVGGIGCVPEKWAALISNQPRPPAHVVGAVALVSWLDILMWWRLVTNLAGVRFSFRYEQKNLRSSVRKSVFEQSCCGCGASIHSLRRKNPIYHRGRQKIDAWKGCQERESVDRCQQIPAKIRNIDQEL